MKLQARVAVHIPGAARLDNGVVGLPSAMGAFVRGLADAVEDLDLVAYDPPKNGAENRDRPDYQFDAPASLRLISLGPKGSMRDLPQRRRRVARIVGNVSHEWDVTIYRLLNRRAGLVARANRCPRTVGYIGGWTRHVLAQIDLPMWRKLVSQPALYVIDRETLAIAKQAGLFLANGEDLIDHFGTLGVPTQLLRTSSTFDADFFQVADRFTNDEICLVVAGRITAPKGVFDAFNAFMLLRDRLDRPVRLVFIGDGDATAQLQAQADSAGVRDAVEFRGWQPAGPKVLQQLRQADALLHLSKAESMPRMVWEAMSQSVPVIATPAGSLPRAFQDGRELVFVPVEDPGGAADAVVRLASDGALRRNMIAAGAEAVKEVSVEAITADLVGRIVRCWPELRVV
ncbi:MAG: glycosyltransferase family 4 protein [Actinobacteria bacterium]|nr:glycosyltransferase family 4 protein [Actinomycetota bacterium]